MHAIQPTLGSQLDASGLEKSQDAGQPVETFPLRSLRICASLTCDEGLVKP